ncbi:hypothetical protein BDQ12DRAFT_672680 [Crucibulum laeve]|uniref:DUF6533 domain-containing protein n=1 Tax=Crucibulum laeve TaxID=68775 RepID=A0A5C3MG80_9AGAR|nr:hypothetical protein BDQ12DRAFT_672680 [Crucibulum laeve]
MSAHTRLFISSGQVASLTFLLYEITITFDDEVDIIWAKPNKSWIKWQFLFTRYFALAVQLVNRSIEMAINSDSVMLTGSLKDWYICQVFVGSILITAVELVLMARVYALYNKNIWIGIGFGVLLCGEVVTMIVGVILNIPGDGFQVDTLLLRSPDSFTYVGISAAVSQITILILTLIKYRAAVRGGWSRLPILQLMVRDGTVAFFVLFIVTTMTAVTTIMDSEYTPIGNSWFLSIVASAGCRLIINMHRLPQQSAEPESETNSFPTTVQLTTLYPDLEMYPSSCSGDRSH